MRSLVYLSCLFCLLLTIACKEDEEDAPANVLRYDDKAYTIVKGYILDFGEDVLHYNYRFLLTDGIADIGTVSVENGNVLLVADLFSSGTAGFQTGSFQFNDTGNVSGKNYFEYAAITTDTNQDGVLNDEDQTFNATAGTIVVSGAPGNYTLDYNITLENGKTAYGKYSGAFEVIDAK